MNFCPFCQAELDGQVYRNTVCPKCARELHVCLACEFYSPGAHYDCKEDVQELVRDKDRANFCEYFRLAKKPASTKSSSSSRAKAEALFNF